MSQLPDVLTQGFNHFYESFYREDTQLMHDLVVEGQHPHTCVIACCDSRVDPAHLFNSKPGDLFVVRAIASHIPKHAERDLAASVIAGIYYAVMVLKVKHLVVMGHSQCGGIKAVVENEQLDNLPESLVAWLKGFASVRDCCHASNHDERLGEAEKAGVIESFEALKTYDFIDDAKTEHGLTVHACHFNIKRGSLVLYDEKTKQFTSGG